MKIERGVICVNGTLVLLYTTRHLFFNHGYSFFAGLSPFYGLMIISTRPLYMYHNMEAFVLFKHVMKYAGTNRVSFSYFQVLERVYRRPSVLPVTSCLRSRRNSSQHLLHSSSCATFFIAPHVSMSIAFSGFLALDTQY